MVIESAKLRDYLLSRSHPVGRFKAQFFFGLGYTQDDWAILAADLKRHVEDGEVTEGESSAYGQKFGVRGRLVGPSGRGAQIVAIWIVLTSEDFPGIVTAFPG